MTLGNEESDVKSSDCAKFRWKDVSDVCVATSCYGCQRRGRDGDVVVVVVVVEYMKKKGGG